MAVTGRLWLPPPLCVLICSVQDISTECLPTKLVLTSSGTLILDGYLSI